MLPKLALVLRKNFQDISLDHQGHWSSNIFKHGACGTQIYQTAKGRGGLIKVGKRRNLASWKSMNIIQKPFNYFGREGIQIYNFYLIRMCCGCLGH